MSKENKKDQNIKNEIKSDTAKSKGSKLNWVYIISFILMTLFPFVCMTFYKTDMSLEKRTAAPFPKIKTYDGKLNLDYFDDLNDYFNDHFAFRQEMTTVDAAITTKLLNTSLNDDVIYGKDGWLYYTETMDEYFGRNILSERGINNCVSSLRLMQEYTENLDSDFLFMICPIKADLYPEHLPYNYKKGSEINNWTRLKTAMDANGIKYVDLHEAFENDSRVMYHKLDTHWNDEGAAFGCKVIQEAAGRSATDYSDISYTTDKVFRGDLYGMLYPKGSKLDDNVIYSQEHSFSYVTNTKNTEDFNIETETPGKEETLLMFRDSYGNALIPFMADEYGKAYFTKVMPFDMGMALQYNADVVMLELTQRHITYLWEYLPVMDAPLRDDVSDSPEKADSLTEVRVDKAADGRLIVYGTLDPEYVDDASNVYVRITDADYISDYEAFPVGYKSVLEEGKSELKKSFEAKGLNEKDYQFGMYISPEELAQGDCEIEVITSKDGVSYTTGNVLTYKNE